MGHEDNGLSTIVDGIFDGGEGSDNTLVVGHLLVRVKRNIEVDLFVPVSFGHAEIVRDDGSYSDQDTLAIEIDITDTELV